MRRFPLIIFISALAASACAQTSVTGIQTSANGVMGGFVGSFAGVRGAAVTGMPYSAQEVTEHVQTLADGTRITQPSQQVTYYRDSQGRTRTERTIPLPPGMASQANTAPAFIDIFDPVSGNRYTLDPRSKTARKVEIVPRPLLRLNLRRA